MCAKDCRTHPCPDDDSCRLADVDAAVVGVFAHVIECQIHSIAVYLSVQVVIIECFRSVITCRTPMLV